MAVEDLIAENELKEVEKLMGGKWTYMGRKLFGLPIYHNVEDLNAKMVYDPETKRSVLKYKTKEFEEPYVNNKS